MSFADAGSTWTELDKYVSSLLAQRKYRDVSEALKDNPITPKSVERMVANGFEVKLHRDFRGGFVAIGGYDGYLRKIIGVGMGNDLSGCWYERDKNLFHELVHIHYGRILDDSISAGAVREERSVITEWMGRQCRAKPELLRSAVLVFDLDPIVYDRSSYDAFSGFFDKRPIFPFAEDYFRRVRTKVLMD